MDKKYNYNGITTEEERTLVCSATCDIKNCADIAFIMLEEIISVHFAQSFASLKKSSAKSEYFLANYDVINTKLNALLDYIDRICIILDFLHGEKTHRTHNLSESLNSLMNFLPT